MKIKQNPKIIHRFIKNTLYVFDDIRMIMHTYNEVGSFIWSIARMPITEKAIIKKVVSEFACTEKKAEGDVRNFLKEEMTKTKLFIRVDR